MPFNLHEQARLITGEDDEGHVILCPFYQRIIAILVTCVLSCIVFLLLKTLRVPEQKQEKEIYREIDWTKFTPQPVEPVDIKQPDNQSGKKEIVDNLSDTKPTDRIDLHSVLDDIKIGKLEDFAEYNYQTENVTSAASDEHMKIELNNGSKTALGLDLAFSGDNGFLQDNNLMGKGGGSADNLKIALKKGSSVKTHTIDYGSGRSSLNGPEAKGDGDEPVQVIALKSMDEIGSEYENLSPIYIPIVEWLKQNPKELPGVVKRFMEYNRGDLTSIVQFSSNNRRFILFLMCKEKGYEVRVSLIEENSLTYLIDKGFKKQSNFLRSGTVTRQSNGEILSLGTERQAASNKKTVEFYQLFLSWWDTAKKELEGS